MKKIMMFAVAALLVTGSAIANKGGGKKKKSCKAKTECCKKGTKDACKKPATTPATPAPAAN